MAVFALKECFGNPEILIEVYARELIKLSNVKANNKDKLLLDKLYNNIEGHLRALESLALNAKDNAAWLCPMGELCLAEDILKV